MLPIIVILLIAGVIFYFVRRTKKETSSFKEIHLPPLSNIKSDYSQHPDYGTASDPMQWGGCTILPPVAWQEPICSTDPNIIWPQSNYYSTADENYWTVSVNNEPAFNSDEVNTGISNRSKKINDGTFTLQHNESMARLRIDMTSENNRQRIPYFALNNTESKTFVGNYGDKMQVVFKLDVDFSQHEKHLHFFHFFLVLEDEQQNIHWAWLYLGHPPTTTKVDINWNWPVKHSIYYPGSKITFWPVQDYVDASNKSITAPSKIVYPGTYNYNFDVDNIIKTLTPHLANEKVKIKGFEISIENEYNWPAGGPFEPMFTEMTISDLYACKF
jgi:hypothetical protein